MEIFLEYIKTHLLNSCRSVIFCNILRYSPMFALCSFVKEGMIFNILDDYITKTEGVHFSFSI